MSDGLKCPNCSFYEFDSDWLYANDMWNPDEDDRKIDCPECNKPFMFKIFSTVGYSVCTLEDYALYGDIE